MENNALRRLEGSLEKLLAQHRKSSERQAQLSAALAKGREQIDAAQAENFRHANERAEVRKRLDGLIARIDSAVAAGDGSDSRDGGGQ